MAKRRKNPISKKARPTKAAPSRVSKLRATAAIAKAEATIKRAKAKIARYKANVVPKAKPKAKPQSKLNVKFYRPLARSQNDANWKKESKWGKIKRYVPKPAIIKWKKSGRKRIPEHHEYEGKQLRSRLYDKLDEFKAPAKRRSIKLIGHSYRLIILADADYGMSNPAISDESAFNLQYWTTPVMRTRKESRAALIELLRMGEEVVTEFSSFEVLKVFRLEFHVNKDGSYSVTEHASKTPSFKLWRP